VIGIGLEDKAESVRDFMKAYEMSYTVLLARDRGIELMQALGNTRAGLPFTVAIDRNGRDRREQAGRDEPRRARCRRRSGPEIAAKDTTMRSRWNRHSTRCQSLPALLRRDAAGLPFRHLRRLPARPGHRRVFRHCRSARRWPPRRCSSPWSPMPAPT
jgi:hypothetical protein